MLYRQGLQAVPVLDAIGVKLGRQFNKGRNPSSVQTPLLIAIVPRVRQVCRFVSTLQLENSLEVLYS